MSKYSLLTAQEWIVLQWYNVNNLFVNSDGEKSQTDDSIEHRSKNESSKEHEWSHLWQNIIVHTYPSDKLNKYDLNNFMFYLDVHIISSDKANIKIE